MLLCDNLYRMDLQSKLSRARNLDAFEKRDLTNLALSSSPLLPSP